MWYHILLVYGIQFWTYGHGRLGTHCVHIVTCRWPKNTDTCDNTEQIQIIMQSLNCDTDSIPYGDTPRHRIWMAARTCQQQKGTVTSNDTAYIEDDDVDVGLRIGELFQLVYVYVSMTVALNVSVLLQRNDHIYGIIHIYFSPIEFNHVRHTFTQSIPWIHPSLYDNGCPGHILYNYLPSTNVYRYIEWYWTY